MSHVVVAMSGGVDSSVAAHLLLREGHRVTGVLMRNGFDDSPEAATNIEDARRVADSLGIELHLCDLADRFTEIVDYFVDEYVSGRTPNPCVVCNRRIKFGALVEFADRLGADSFATGHYARVAADESGTPVLCRGVDPTKDQSYVLFNVRREVLGRIVLPVGHFEKTEIRRLAAELGLSVADKRDSQDVCFVPAGLHAEFIHRRRPGLDTSGPIVTTDGREVGEHSGIERFTIGQRHGLGVAMGEPYYVVRIEAPARRVVIGRRDELARHELAADGANWLVDPPEGPVPCMAKPRYNTPPQQAMLYVLPERRLRVVFDKAQFGIAPGQAVVCYDGIRVLGGGWIVEPGATC